MSKPKRRKAIPKWLRAMVAMRQEGRCHCGCGEKLQPGFHLDHDPPLELRLWDEELNDTVPPSNSPDHLTGLTPACHGRKTNRPLGPHTSYGGDRHAIAKDKRIRGEVGQNKPKTVWPKREFQKRKDYTPRPPRRIDRGE